MGLAVETMEHRGAASSDRWHFYFGGGYLCGRTAHECRWMSVSLGPTKNDRAGDDFWGTIGAT